jgi:hypothetical protein
MKQLILILSLILIACPARSQTVDRAELEKITRENALGVQPAASPYSLIDLSRLKWSHSYSVSYVSGSGYSGSLGMMRTSMFYEFSPKLSLTLNMGIAHDPSSLIGNNSGSATFLPGFTLDYHPSDSFRMSVSYQRMIGMDPFRWGNSMFDRPIGP